MTGARIVAPHFVADMIRRAKAAGIRVVEVGDG